MAPLLGAAPARRPRNGNIVAAMHAGLELLDVWLRRCTVATRTEVLAGAAVAGLVAATLRGLAGQGVRWTARCTTSIVDLWTCGRGRLHETRREHMPDANQERAGLQREAGVWDDHPGLPLHGHPASHPLRQRIGPRYAEISCFAIPLRASSERKPSPLPTARAPNQHRPDLFPKRLSPLIGCV